MYSAAHKYSILTQPDHKRDTQKRSRYPTISRVNKPGKGATRTKTTGIDDQYDRPHTRPAELNLIAAVVIRAMFDVQSRARPTGTQDCQTQWCAQAHEWFRDKSTAPFTWLWCAEALDLDPVATARLILSKAVSEEDTIEYIRSMKRRGNIFHLAKIDKVWPN